MTTSLIVAALATLGSNWEELNADAPWSKRSDLQLALLNNKLILMGGHANSDYYNDVWASDDGGKTWTELLAEAPWAPRSYHMAKVMRYEGKEDALFLCGGHDKDTWYNDVWKTTDGKTWKSVGNATWTPRAAAALQIRKNKMFVMGGSNGLLKPIGNGTVLNDVWVSEDEGKTWELALASAPWPAREGLQKLTALYGANETIILTAGEAGYSGPYYNDVWGTMDGISWTMLEPAADFSARSGNLLLNAEGSLFTFGGYGVPMKHDGYCLPASSSGSAMEWRRLADAPWHGRFDYDWELVNGSIVLVGGEASLFGAGGPYFNDVWRFTAPTCV